MAAKNAAASKSDQGVREQSGKALSTGEPRAVFPEKAAARIDRLVHERARLGILSALAVNDALTFNDLKKLLGATDGNLSVHARKLEEAGYVGCSKTFKGRVPRTEYKLTASGRRALEKYLDHMESLIQATRQA